MEKENDTFRKTKAPGCWGNWLRIAAKFHHFLEKVFYKYGYFISAYPLVVMTVCVIFTASVGWGITKLKVESRTEKLYVPQNSKAEQDLDAAEKYFQIRSRLIRVMVTHKDHSNVLNKDAFTVALEVLQGIMYNTTLEEQCIKGPAVSPYINPKTAGCLRTDPLELFNYSNNEIQKGNILNQFNELLFHPNYTMRNGRPLSDNVDTILGGIVKHSNGSMLSAKALRFEFLTKHASTDAEYEKALEWEENFLKYITSVKESLKSKKYDLYFFTFKSIDNSINESTGGDILFISITFCIMCTFTCFALGRFRNRVTGHSTAGIIGLIAVLMGIGSAFGLLLLCEVTFVATVGILPFLIVGVAIDDMFIIMDELDRTDFRLPTRVIIATVLGRIGGSVTMTTLTDLVAFAVSTTSAFPAIQYFCVYAAVGLTFSYMMIMTFFVAYLVFEIGRIKKGRYDSIPCLRKKDFQIDQNTGLIVTPTTQFSMKIMRKLGQFVTNNYARVIVTLGAMGLVAVGVVGALSISQKFTLQMLGKDGSEYIKYLDMETKYFQDSTRVSVIVPHSSKVTTTEGQLEYAKLSNTMINSHKSMLNKSIDWFNEFKRWANSSKKNTTGHNFVPSVGQFLSIPKYRRYGNDVKFSNDSTKILASRIVVFMQNEEDSSKNKDAMLKIREAAENIPVLEALTAGVEFLYFEQYVLVVPETTRNVIICGLTVLLMTAPFLLHPGILFLMVLSFAALILELLGLMAVWNVSLNSISMIILTMAIGFCVDYSAHVAHAYVISDAPDAKSGVIHALETIGTSVFMGGFSTFLGMLVTGFSSSEIFRIFFKMFFGIVGLGLIHGLVILPTLIAVFKISRSPTNGVRADQTNGVVIANKVNADAQDNHESNGVALPVIGTEEGMGKENGTVFNNKAITKNL